MPFITFIYKIGKNSKTYYGKYVSDCISDDHEGLDYEITPSLLNGINEYRRKNHLPEIKRKQITIGILSFSINEWIPTYSSKKEIKCFDFYHEYYKYEFSTYINGKLIESSG